MQGMPRCTNTAVFANLCPFLYFPTFEKADCSIFMCVWLLTTLLSDRYGTRRSQISFKKFLAMIFLFFLLPISMSSPQIDCFVDDEQCEITAENLVETIFEVASSEECLAFCDDDLNCTSFTHFSSSSHPFPRACFLFSSCTSRVMCNNCTTGTPQSECTCGQRWNLSMPSVPAAV